MRDYKKYDVWNNADELVLSIYRDVIIEMPNLERFNLTSQMKRAAYLIPLNIVEG